MEEVRFFRGTSKFSNFHPCPLAYTLGGRAFTAPSVEHWFQALKFERTDPAWAERILRAATPAEAKRLGSKRGCGGRAVDPLWDTRRLEVMKALLEVKFAPGTDARRALEATRGRRLVENSPFDYFWGCGRTGTGQNMLGRLLMEIRDE
jgi:N-glycosidase YbiA